MKTLICLIAVLLAVNVVGTPLSAQDNSNSAGQQIPVPAGWKKLANPAIEIYIDGDLRQLEEVGIDVQPLVRWVRERFPQDSRLGVDDWSSLTAEVVHFRFGCSRLRVSDQNELGLPSEFQMPNLFYLRLFFGEDSRIHQHLIRQLNPASAPHLRMLDRDVFFWNGQPSHDGTAEKPTLLVASGDARSIVIGTPTFFADRQRRFARNISIGFSMMDEERGLGCIVDFTNQKLPIPFVAVSLGTPADSVQVTMLRNVDSTVSAQALQLKNAATTDPESLTKGLANNDQFSLETATAVVTLLQSMVVETAEEENSSTLNLRIPGQHTSEFNLILKSLVQPKSSPAGIR